jgi:hypothetical protein
MSYPPQPPSEPDDSGSTPPPPPPYGSAPPPPPPYGGTPGYPPAPGGYGAVPRGNQKALWSMILGIGGLLCCVVLAIVAIVLGNQAKKEIAASGGMQTGAGQAQAGIVLGIIGCVLGVAAIAFYAIGVASGT